MAHSLFHPVAATACRVIRPLFGGQGGGLELAAVMEAQEERERDLRPDPVERPGPSLHRAQLVPQFRPDNHRCCRCGPVGPAGNEVVCCRAEYIFLRGGGRGTPPGFFWSGYPHLGIFHRRGSIDRVVMIG